MTLPCSKLEHRQRCHELGLGVPQKYQEARRLYELSAAQDHATRATHTRAEALKNLKKKIRNECPLLGRRVEVTGTSRGDLDGKFGVVASFDD